LFQEIVAFAPDSASLSVGADLFRTFIAQDAFFLGVWSKYSCDATVIVFEEPPEAFSTADVRSAACSPIVSRREQQEIVFTLVVSFSMIVLCELA